MRSMGSQAQSPWDGSAESRASITQRQQRCSQALSVGVTTAEVWLSSLLFALVCLPGRLSSTAHPFLVKMSPGQSLLVAPENLRQGLRLGLHLCRNPLSAQLSVI